MISLREVLGPNLILPRYRVDWAGFGDALGRTLLTKAKEKGWNVVGESHRFGLVDATFKWELTKVKDIVAPVSRDVSGRVVIRAIKSKDVLKFGIDSAGPLLNANEWLPIAKDVWNSSSWVRPLLNV